MDRVLRTKNQLWTFLQNISVACFCNIIIVFKRSKINKSLLWYEVTNNLQMIIMTIKCIGVRMWERFSRQPLYVALYAKLSNICVDMCWTFFRVFLWTKLMKETQQQRRRRQIIRDNRVEVWNLYRLEIKFDAESSSSNWKCTLGPLYKTSTIVIYDSRVTRELLIIKTQES